LEKTKIISGRRAIPAIIGHAVKKKVFRGRIWTFQTRKKRRVFRKSYADVAKKT